MLQTLFVSSLTTNSASQAQPPITKGEDTLFSFVVDNEPAMFLKLASHWLCLAWQYQATGGRYNTCVEYITSVINENVNLALFNLDSFSGWLHFLSTLPCVDKSIPAHISAVLKQIKLHQVEPFFTTLIKKVLVSQLGYKLTLVD